MYEINEKEKKRSTGIIFLIIITIGSMVFLYTILGKKNNTIIMKETVKTIEAKERTVENDVTEYKVPLDDFTSVEFEKRIYKIPDEYIFSINDGIFKISLKNSFECRIKVLNKKFSSVISDKNKIKKDIEKENKVNSLKEVKYDGEKYLKYEINNKHVIFYRKHSNIKSYRIEIISNDKSAEEILKKHIIKIIGKSS